MKTAQQGDRVRIHFTGTLEDGTVFDSTEQECDSEDCGCEEGPFELVLGEGEFLPELEEALVGLAPGEEKTVKIAADEAYGPYDEELLLVVGRGEFPPDFTPEVGQTLEITDEEGESYPVTVVEVADEEVTLDANHPLAGEDLTFDLRLLEIL
jgi:peptidylprolyl isomerase